MHQHQPTPPTTEATDPRRTADEPPRRAADVAEHDLAMAVALTHCRVLWHYTGTASDLCAWLATQRAS